MTTIITSLFGDYDDLRAQAEQSIEITQWIAVTDRYTSVVPEPWRLQVVTPKYDHPRMSAKRFKAEPWLATEDPDVIYIDANMRVTSEYFAEEALISRHNGIATWRHPYRETIAEEAEASVELAPKKYADQPVMEQVRHYYRIGYPDDLGLFACGTIAYDTSDPRIVEFGGRWLKECEQWSYQDQLSFPVVCWRLGITAGTFPHRQIRSSRRLYNPWLRIEPHKFDN